MFSLKLNTIQRMLLGAAVIAAVLAFVAQVGWTLYSSGSGPLYVSSSPEISLPMEISESWRTMPVQFGRIKPLGVAAAEWVRQITGKERFAGVDPLALVVDWRMRLIPEKDGAIDWEEFPIILCDWPPLREVVLADAEKAGKSRGGEHTRYLSAAALKSSPGFVSILRGAAKQRTDGGAKASLVMSIDEQRAEEVSRRLSLFDAVRGRQYTPLAGGVIVNDKFIDDPNYKPGAESSLPKTGPLADLKHKDPWRILPVGGDVKGEWLALNEICWIGRGQQAAKIPGEPAVSPERLERLVDRLAPLAQEWALLIAYRSQHPDGKSPNWDSFATTLATVAGEEAADPIPKSDGEAIAAAGAYPYLPTNLAIEVYLQDRRPFFWSWVLMLVAAIGLAGAMIGESPAAYRVSLGVYGVSLACQIVGLTLRTIVAGRAPVASMYETVVFAAIIAGILGLILEAVYRLQVIALAASLVTSLGLMLADQLPMALDPTIAPLVPVLRTNFWLMLHVLTIVGGYAAGTLAWGLGNLSLGLLAFGKPSTEQVKLLARFTYRGMQVTVVLLAAGTLLGAAWAADAWGRYWGWDPKEIAALVALVVYVWPLHARFVGVIDELGLLIAGVACFGAIVMSWYVVNFLLAAGLHSYGFSSGGAGWVLAAVLLNLVWVLVCCWRLSEVVDGEPVATTEETPVSVAS